MTSLRWLAWPTPRRSDGALVTYAHGFIRRETFETGATLERAALCGIERPSVGRLVRFALPSSAYERCHWCDQKCRELGGPHPPVNLKLSADLYEPVHLFEEWASL